MKRILCSLILLQNLIFLPSIASQETIQSIELATGPLPSHSFPTPNGNPSWDVYVIDKDHKKLFFSVTRGYASNSDQTLVDIDNLAFNLHDPEKAYFEHTEQSVDTAVCGEDFVLLHDTQALYIINENQITNFDFEDSYIHAISANKKFVYCLPYVVTKLTRYNTVAQNFGTIEHIANFMTTKKSPTHGAEQPRNLKRSLGIWQDSETKDYKVMFLNSGHIITIPYGIVPINKYSYILTKDEQKLYVPGHDINRNYWVCIYNTEKNHWNIKVGLCDGIWGVTPECKYILIYSHYPKDTPVPNKIFDLLTYPTEPKSLIEISGMDTLNERARNLGIGPDKEDDGWLWYLYSGTNKMIFSTIYRPEHNPDVYTRPLGFIIDIADKSVQIYDEQQSFLVYPITTAEDGYVFARYRTSNEDNIKRYNFAKIYLDETPIEWIEDVEMQSLREHSFPMYNFSEYQLVTYPNGHEELLQLPQYVFFDARMKKYISDDIFEFVYIPETNRAIIVKKRNDNDQNPYLYSYLITICNVDTHEILQKFACDTYRYATTSDNNVVYLVTNILDNEQASVWDVTDYGFNNNEFSKIIKTIENQEDPQKSYSFCSLQ